MLTAAITDLLDRHTWLGSPILLLVSLFSLWMLVDAIRRREWIWAIFIFIGWGISALFYYLMVYRDTPSATRGFELPGAVNRKRIKELQAQIHHLDKAHHHLQLADIYFQQGKLQKAEASYRASLEREPDDLEARAHLGQCLLRQQRAAEAKPLLEGVINENPEHEYGYTMMALAETLGALGDRGGAMRLWRQVTDSHSYPRAKVQLAELLFAEGQPDQARAQLKDALADDAHAPAFQRRRDRIWISRAKSLMRKLS